MMIKAIRQPRRFFLRGAPLTGRSSSGATKRSSRPPPIRGSVGASVCVEDGTDASVAEAVVGVVSAAGAGRVAEGTSSRGVGTASDEESVSACESAGSETVSVSAIGSDAPGVRRAASRAARREPGAGALLSTVGCC
jgi:hypothetical protein